MDIFALNKIGDIIWKSGADEDLINELMQYSMAVQSPRIKVVSYESGDESVQPEPKRLDNEKLTDDEKYYAIIKMIWETEIPGEEKLNLVMTLSELCIPFEGVDVFSLTRDEKKQLIEKYTKT